MKKSFSLWFVVIPDLALLFFSLYFAIILRYPEGLTESYWQSHFQVFGYLFLVWMLVFFMHGLFDANSFRRFSGLVLKLSVAMMVNLLISIIYFYFQPDLILTPRRFLLITVGVSFVFLLLWHLIIKYILKNRLVEGLYLFSFDNELKDLEKEIESHKFLGFKVLGHLNLNNLDSQRLDYNAGVVLPDNLHSHPEILQKFYTLRKNGAAFYNYRNFYENLLRRVYLNEINELWFLENINYQEKRFYNFIKRLLDIFFGFVGSALFLLSFPIVALLTKLTSPGSILFVQERVGKHGKIFKVYKYRTMRAGTKTDTWTSVNDSRVTSFGKFLRKSRIDEWPQFFNLLIGNMSLVGPRPEQPNIVEDLRKQIPFYDERHLVKPGITGWAQINNIYAGSEEETRLKLQYDLYYIKHRGLLFDLEIILKTVYYIFTWQGR
ncbi:MAG: sugar transferase [Candidatus Doudnabacteria bacterium]|nr:sugar transferase [Candidatus Doudnabacteria bacterium]